MKDFLFVFFLLSFGINSFCQSSFFEKQKGVKKIRHTKKAGQLVPRPQFFFGSEEFFDEEGNLIKVNRGPKSEANYIHKPNSIIQASTVADCISAWEIFITKKQYSSIVRSKVYIGDGYWGSECQHPFEIFEREVKGELIFNEEFKDVEKLITLEEDSLTYISYSYWNSDSTKFKILNYDRTPNQFQYKLTNISISETLSNGFHFWKLFAVDFSNNNNIILTHQSLMDDQHSYMESLGNKEIYVPGENIEPMYKYEFDEKGNWIKRTLINPKPGRMEESYREYTYY